LKLSKNVSRKSDTAGSEELALCLDGDFVAAYFHTPLQVQIYVSQTFMKRTVGIYICCVAIAQLIFYSVAYFNERAVWLFYFDPRMGLFVLESSVRSREVFPGLLSWLSAVVLAGVGFGLLRNMHSVKAYLFTEFICAVPSVVFFGSVVFANVSPAHGFSIAELVLPLLVFLVASAIPFWLALQSLRTEKAG
jgi:hypothetical protein